MGSPAAPPLCNLVATVEDFFWHQTMCSLRFRMPDVGVIWHERYVDNRFILLRDSAPHSPVLMNFLSLEFYRPPVMLEVQHDDKVLGYRCDSSSRTITPQLPDHPSQIKGIRSANDQMFTYSSWSSRSWLIIRGAQPAVQQQHGLNALKRLYEAKGFDPHLLHDVRRRLGTKSACGLVAWLRIVSACDCLLMCCDVSACSWLKTMAEYTVTSLLRPDGSVQTTSRVALEHLPNFINGNEMQMFVRTHGLVHQHNVQAHSSSRDAPALGSEANIRAVRNHTVGRRSRSPRSRHSRIRLTPGPQGKSDDEEDWGDWKSDGRRAHDDQRRPRSPTMPPTQVRAPENHIELLPLPVRQHVPDLGSHRFKLRTGCRIEEIAILVNGVLYYTLPSIAALVFPEPEQWKKSWETVYRSLMPHRRNIIEDEQRVKSISELPFSPLPHDFPGPWTDQVVREIASYFQISPKSLPPQLIVHICEEGWPYIRRTTRTYHHFSP